MFSGRILTKNSISIYLFVDSHLTTGKCSKHSLMMRGNEQSFVYDEVIQRCNGLLKNNFIQLFRCMKRQDILRSVLIFPNDEYDLLKKWLRTVYEDVILMKSKRRYLRSHYETLLKNNLVKTIFENANEQELFQLKFVEAVIECKNLKTSIELIDRSFISLKSDYNKVTRRYEKLTNNNMAEEFSDLTKYQKNLRLKFMHVIEECERLKICVDTANDNIMLLSSEYDDVIKRQEALLENSFVQEFLNCAKDLEPSNLIGTRRKNECTCLESCHNRAKNEIASLKLRLRENRKILNTGRQRHASVIKERNNLDYLSEELCRLLHKYQCTVSPKKVEKNHTITDECIQKSAKDTYIPDYKKSENESDSFSISEISVSLMNNEIENIEIYDNSEGDQQISQFKIYNDQTSFIENNGTATITSSVNEWLKSSTPHFLNYYSSKEGNDRAASLSDATENQDDVLNEEDSSDPRCNVCDRYFSRKSSLKRHVKSKHFEDEPFKYTDRATTFASSYNLRRYKFRTCLRNQFKPIASKKLNSYVDGDKLLSKRHKLKSSQLFERSSMKRFPCSVCDRCFKWNKTRLRHERNVHGL